MLSYKALPGPLGIEITGLNLAEPSTDALRDVMRLFYRHQFVVIRKQTLDLPQFDRFTRQVAISDHTSSSISGCRDIRRF